MPQFGIIAVEDTASPVVVHNFTPNGIDSGTAKVVERTGVPVADPRMTLTGTTTSAGREKRTINITVPVMQDQIVGGISRLTVVRTGYAKIEFSFDASSTKRERADLRQYVNTLLYPVLNPGVEKWVVDLEGFY